MWKNPGVVSLLSAALNAAAPSPLYRHLYEVLRGLILRGQLPPGDRLPATRSLAADLDVSRNTVKLAFEQLLCEGYVEGRVGSGTYESRALPDQPLHGHEPAARPPRRRGPCCLGAGRPWRRRPWRRPGRATNAVPSRRACRRSTPTR